MESLILQDALKYDLGEAVVACDMPEQCKFPFLESCQKRFLWAHNEVEFISRWCCAPSRRYGEVSSNTWFRRPGSFFQSQQAGSCFTAVEEDGGNKRHVEVELARKGDGVASPDPV